MSSYVCYQCFLKRGPWISSITSPRNMKEIDFQAWPQPYWIRNSGVGFQREKVDGMWWDRSSRTDIAGASEPELPSTVAQVVHCTTDGDAIHQSRMRMSPPRVVQCKTCIPNLAVLKTVGNPQRSFNRGKTQSEWSVKRPWWQWCYLGDRWWGTPSSHSVPCIYPQGCL